jgi:hypothetical protein
MFKKFDNGSAQFVTNNAEAFSWTSNKCRLSKNSKKEKIRATIRSYPKKCNSIEMEELYS